MAEPKKPSIDQMMAELRQRAVGPKEPFDPIGTAKRNIKGIYEGVSAIPGNVKRMVQDPVAYAKSIPSPTGDQIMNALGPGNVGMAGIMIGPKAKTWHTGRAQMAEAMEQAGRAPEEIWYATGTYRGPGGAWRQEIDDSKAVHRFPGDISEKAQNLRGQQKALKEATKESLARGKEVVSDLFPKEAVAARREAKQKISDIEDDVGGYYGLGADPRRGNLMKYGYEHPELYAAYPELRDYVFSQGVMGEPGTLGSLGGKNVNLYHAGLNQKQPSSTVAHELQHAIQGIEGTPRGGNTYEFMQVRDQANHMLPKNTKNIDEKIALRGATTDPDIRAVLKEQIDKLLNERKMLTRYNQIDPYEEYRLLGGEAESRMIQNRLNMTPEERAKTFPLQLSKDVAYDVDPKHLRLLDQGQSIDIYKANGGGVEVRPTVKDDAIQRKVPEMEAAARAVQEGKMGHADYDKVVNKHKPVKPYTFVPQPASDEDAKRALHDTKQQHWRGAERWPTGRKVGLRLDIPSYENHGVWINSIHDEEGKGESKYKTSYGPVSSVKNATFDAGPHKAIKVATGEDNKTPFARIKGELHHMHESEAIEHMQKYLNHPDYAQVGMDPRRHGFFYDRKTLQPITHAEHVVQIGPLVLAHKPTYGERETYRAGGKVK
jgi:hypothetical protein